MEAEVIAKYSDLKKIPSNLINNERIEINDEEAQGNYGYKVLEKITKKEVLIYRLALNNDNEEVFVKIPDILKGLLELSKEVENKVINANMSTFSYLWSFLKTNKDHVAAGDAHIFQLTKGMIVLTPYDSICTLLNIRTFNFDCGEDAIAFYTFLPPSHFHTGAFDLELEKGNNMEKLHIVSTSRYTSFVKYVLRRFEYSDYVNAWLFSKMTFPEIGAMYANDNFAKALYDYLKYPQLTFSNVCLFFQVKEIDVVRMYIDTYKACATSVMREFEQTLDMPIGKLSQYLFSNLLYIQKYLDINYLTAQIFSKTYMALLCYLFGCNKIGIYIILNFLQKVKLNASNEITIDDMSYNRVNYYIDRQFNTFYKEDKTYSIFDNKKKCEIETKTVPKTDMQPIIGRITPNYSNGKFDFKPICNKIKPVDLSEKQDEIKVSDSYILSIGKQTQQYMQEVFPYSDYGQRYFEKREKMSDEAIKLEERLEKVKNDIQMNEKKEQEVKEKKEQEAKKEQGENPMRERNSN